jgi:hypothetical protein
MGSLLLHAKDLGPRSKEPPSSATQPLPHPLAWLGEPALEGSVLEREEGHKWDM